MVSNYAENGIEIQYRLRAVRYCHIDEIQTLALNHERLRPLLVEVEASTPNRSNDDHMANIPAENGVDI